MNEPRSPMTSSAPSSSTQLRLAFELARWHRPEGWLLLLWPTLIALWVAARGFPGWHLLMVFVLGTVMMRSAGCCLNDAADADFDRRVERTRQRPIARGAVSRGRALAMAGALSLVSFGLVLSTNAFAIAWAGLGAAVAAGYPFAKRVLAMPQIVLGVAFSLGIPVAFTAVHGSGPLGLGPAPSAVLWLTTANMLWVLAYDTVYAMVDREDDVKIGVRSSAIALGHWDVAAVTSLYALSLLCWWGTLAWLVGGALVHLAALVAAAMLVGHVAAVRSGSRKCRFRSFVANHWIGAVLFSGVLLSYALDLGWPAA